MSDVRLTKIRTSLARKMAQPGGRTVAEAERRANERLALHRDDVMATIQQRIAELEKVVAEASPQRQGDVYLLAAGLLDTGGFFDTGPLFDAGFSLCEVAELMSASGQWHWPSVEVHVRALRLILTNGCKADATSDALLVGLRSVVAKARGDG